MEPLLAPMTPAPDRTTSHFTDADVASVSPLRVRLAGDAAEIDADSLISAGALAVGDRVRVELAGRRVVVHGRAGGGTSGTLAVGMVIDWPAGSPTPAYALDCDGQAVSRSAYASLFGTIGTAYGTGDGSTTFNVPNLRHGVYAFHAVGTGILNKTGVTSFSKIALTMETLDTDEVYDALNSRFVAPVDGVYQLTVTIAQSSGGVTGPVVRLMKNGIQMSETPNDTAIAYTSYNTATRTIVASLVAGDQIEPFWGNANNTTAALDATRSSFAGHLVSPRAAYTTQSPTRKIIVATDQGSGATIVSGSGGYTLGQVVDWIAGAPTPANHLELDGQTVNAAHYSALAALYPGWVSGDSLMLPDLRSPSRAVQLTKASAQSTSATAGTTTPIAWTADASASGMFSASDNTKIFPNRMGKWRVTAKVRGAGSANYLALQIRMNGVTTSNGPSEDARTDTVTGAYPRAEYIFDVVSPGFDYFEAYVFAGAASVALVPANCIFIAEFVGSSDGYEPGSRTTKLICAADSAGEYSPTVQAALTSRITSLENASWRGISGAGVVSGGATATVDPTTGTVTVPAGCTYVQFNGLLDPRFEYEFVFDTQIDGKHPTDYSLAFRMCENGAVNAAAAYNVGGSWGMYNGTGGVYAASGTSLGYLGYVGGNGTYVSFSNTARFRAATANGQNVKEWFFSFESFAGGSARGVRAGGYTPPASNSFDGIVFIFNQLQTGLGRGFIHVRRRKIQ